MLFAAGWLTYKGVSLQLADLEVATDGRTGANVTTAGAIFGNSTFRNIILSVVSTYGLYFTASFMFFEPYHMFNSLIQYLLLVPFYINILNVYAFCNVHDISWGTKGDTASAAKHNDLGSVATGADKTVVVQVPTEAMDINELYQDAVDELQRKRDDGDDDVDENVDEASLSPEQFVKRKKKVTRKSKKRRRKKKKNNKKIIIKVSVHVLYWFGSLVMLHWLQVSQTVVSL
jgi:hypothetical protein